MPVGEPGPVVVQVSPGFHRRVGAGVAGAARRAPATTSIEKSGNASSRRGGPSSTWTGSLRGPPASCGLSLKPESPVVTTTSGSGVVPEDHPGSSFARGSSEVLNELVGERI